MSTLRAYVIVALVLAVTTVALWRIVRTSPTEISNLVPGQKIVALPPSAGVQAYLAKSNGFQSLVSFTERGFEPTTVSVQKGETIRFINNSEHDLWIASTGDSGTVYPGTGHECGQSAFDTCRALKKGEFWEFTFSTVGAWSYHDNFDVERTGVVVVQ